MDKLSSEVFIKRAEIQRLLRYLMFENPLEAEQYAVDIPELREADVSGVGALEFSTPNGSEYIVYSHGTKYTTTVRPTHIPSDQIRLVKPPLAGETLWPRLKDNCEALRQLSSDAYTQFGLGRILDSIAYFYSSPSTPEERPAARYVEALANLGEFSKLTGDDAIKDWVGKCRSQLLQLYASHILAGDEVKQALATFVFFGLCPFPVTKLFEMNQEFFHYRFGEMLDGKPIVMAFPLMDLRFYLGHPVVRPDLAVVWGTGAARILQDKAEELRDSAKLRYTIEQFHFELYLSLLYYRCALYAYRMVLSSAKAKLVTGERALQRIEAARSEEALCEEHRVLIMTSLTAVLEARRVAFPSIANVVQVHNWVAHLTEVFPKEAEIRIRQAYDAELTMPKFLRDLALGILACITDQPKDGLTKLLAVMQDLEKHLDIAMTMGDPNYLSSTYGIMAAVAAKNGMDSESVEYSRRSEPSYYQKLANVT